MPQTLLSYLKLKLVSVISYFLIITSFADIYKVASIPIFYQ